MLKWKFFRSKWTALVWFTIMTILFLLPGSAFPQDNWLSRINFDKWVHIGLFGGLVFLWLSAFGRTDNSRMILIVTAILYGVAVEYVQQQWVANRSFDVYDIIADAGGVFLGWVVWWWVYKKNKPL